MYYKNMPEIKVVVENDIKNRKIKTKETWRSILIMGLRKVEKLKGIKSPKEEK